VLVESLLLAFAGGALGLLLCGWAGGILVRLASVDLPEGSGIQFNATLLLFTFAVCIGTALLFGLAPAFRAAAVDVNEGVKQGGRGQSTGHKHGRVLDSLVTAQFALAFLLLVSAGLLLRSFGHLLATNPGFRTDHILRMDVSLPGEAYPSAGDIRAFYGRLDDSLRRLPGVKAAGLATSLPLNIEEHRSFLIEGQGAQEAFTPHSTAHIWVIGDFFQAMGVPLLRGRSLDERDSATSMPVVVVNLALAHKFWPHQNPLGQRISWGDKGDPWMTIVGVVGDVKQGALNDISVVPETYSPWRQVKDDDLKSTIDSEYRTMTVVARTANTPTAEAPAIEKLIHSLDPSLPVTNVTTMEAQLQNSVRSQRFQTALLGGFAIAALVLAALGIAGVLAYSVAQRVSEIGIRMALGASRASVLSLILVRGMKLAITGTAIGFAAALITTRLLSHVLYETSPFDVVTFCSAPAFLCLVGLLATLFPAQRAATVDPVRSLRTE
jgi:putative ABC transport system permease protein